MTVNQIRFTNDFLLIIANMYFTQMGVEKKKQTSLDFTNDLSVLIKLILNFSFFNASNFSASVQDDVST